MNKRPCSGTSRCFWEGKCIDFFQELTYIVFLGWGFPVSGFVLSGPEDRVRWAKWQILHFQLSISIYCIMNVSVDLLIACSALSQSCLQPPSFGLPLEAELDQKWLRIQTSQPLTLASATCDQAWWAEEVFETQEDPSVEELIHT